MLRCSSCRVVGNLVIYGLGDLVEVGGADRIHRLSLALAAPVLTLVLAISVPSFFTVLIAGW